MPTDRLRRGFVPGVLFAGLLLTLPACSSGGSQNAVRGKVLVNGQPAANAMLVFHLEGGGISTMPPTAKAGPDGTFTVQTGDKPGAPVGKYTVTVVWPDPSKKLTEKEIMMGANPNDGPDLLKGRYATPKDSTLKVEIKSGDNQLEPFDLK